MTNCEYCQASFSTDKALRVHMKKKHEAQEEEKKETVGIPSESAVKLSTIEELEEKTSDEVKTPVVPIRGPQSALPEKTLSQEEPPKLILAKLTDDWIKSQIPKLTEEDVLKGSEGFARYAFNVLFRNRILPVSNKTILGKGFIYYDNDVLSYDPKGYQLCDKLFPFTEAHSMTLIDSILMKLTQKCSETEDLEEMTDIELEMKRMDKLRQDIKDATLINNQFVHEYIKEFHKLVNAN